MLIMIIIKFQFLAAKYGHLELLKWLLDKNCDVNAVSNCNRTPLLLAARYGQTAVLDTLKTFGALIHIRELKAGYTALLCAVVEGHADVAKWLVENGDNVNGANDNGRFVNHIFTISCLD
jgi:uncharacterized protein